MWFWIFSTIFWTFVMSFYSMQEMACISFNRLRLEFAVREGSTRAKWIKHMLDNPMLLFGTTLVGVNLSLVLSSESMRRVFTTFDINPNLSPIIEAPYMIVCGELIPMFAARLFPEHMARLGIPLLWLSSKLLFPITFFINGLLKVLQTIFSFGKRTPQTPLVHRDELRELIEERKRSFHETPETQLESMVGQIFNLREIPVSQIMIPIAQFPVVKTSFFVSSAQELLLAKKKSLAIVKNKQDKIIGYIQSKNLITASRKASIEPFVHTSIFVSEETNCIDTLFLLQKDHIAFVVSSGGEIIGLITYNNLLAELAKGTGGEYLLHIEKTLSAETRVDKFLEQYHLSLSSIPEETFAELVERLLGHKPSVSDTAHLGPLEISVKEITIRGAKVVVVKTTS